MATDVRLSIYNARGQVVRQLIDAHAPTGYHEVIWDGRDDRGRVLASGLYFYRLQTPQGVLTRRLVLLK